MPGFFISNESIDISLENSIPETCLLEEMRYGGQTIRRNTLDKFLQDKAFEQNQDIILIAEGVLLNKVELFDRYCAKTVFELVIKMRSSGEAPFFREFRGSFSGALYDKKTGKWTIWTNQYGDNAVFYYWDGKRFFIGSQVNYILSAIRKLHIHLSLDNAAIIFMLTYGYMEDERTYAQEIKRLRPGSYIEIEGDKFDVQDYWRIRRNVFDLSGYDEKSILDDLDQHFRRAIKREYDKDIEYGFRHLTDLSGGLDSRMNAWVARDLGYEHILNATFCQSNYADEKVAKQIAEALGNEMVFKTLDEASFLLDLDTITSMNYGLAVYSGVAGGKKMLDVLDCRQFGVEHTGQMGDVVVGTFVKATSEMSDLAIGGLYSETFKDKAEDVSTRTMYSDRESYLLSVRGFFGCLSSHLVKRNYTELTSPFLDVDVLEFCLSIPIELRIGHKFYKRWINERYPLAGTYVWEAEGVPPRYSNIRRRIYRLMVRGPRKLLRIVSGRERQRKDSMNPIGYWYETNPHVRSFIDSYFERNITMNIVPEDARRNMYHLFEKGTAQEKLQVITALSALRYYFDE